MICLPERVAPVQATNLTGNDVILLGVGVLALLIFILMLIRRFHTVVDDAASRVFRLQIISRCGHSRWQSLSYSNVTMTAGTINTYG